jgi:hypothetical protein
MAKRAVRKAEAVVDPEESEYKVGAVVSYYDDGWRTGTIDELDVSDDGDLLVTVQPIGSKYATTKPRKVKHKSKDLKLA